MAFLISNKMPDVQIGTKLRHTKDRSWDRTRAPWMMFSDIDRALGLIDRGMLHTNYFETIAADMRENSSVLAQDFSLKRLQTH